MEFLVCFPRYILQIFSYFVESTFHLPTYLQLHPILLSYFLRKAGIFKRKSKHIGSFAMHYLKSLYLSLHRSFICTRSVSLSSLILFLGFLILHIRPKLLSSAFNLSVFVIPLEPVSASALLLHSFYVSVCPGISPM